MTHKVWGYVSTTLCDVRCNNCFPRKAVGPAEEYQPVYSWDHPYEYMCEHCLDTLFELETGEKYDKTRHVL